MAKETKDDVAAAVKAGFWIGSLRGKWFVGRYAGTATQYFPEYGADMTKAEARTVMVCEWRKVAK